MTKTRGKAIHEYSEMKMNNCFNILSVSALLTERKINENPDNVLMYVGGFCSEVKSLFSDAASEMVAFFQEQNLVLSAKDYDMIKGLCKNRIINNVINVIEKNIMPTIKNVVGDNRTIETSLNLLPGNTIAAFLDRLYLYQLSETLSMDDKAIKQSKRNNRIALISAVVAGLALLFSVLTYFIK